ncbi:MAG TPA: hypothetical protein PKA17_04320, partial [Phenylobacterium sp.]|nr:hypothetical protein [Phenylobacterium sp.]
HAIVATKAATQVFAHLAKIIVYGTPLLLAGADQATAAALPPPWAFALFLPLSMAGTWCGGAVPGRLTRGDFPPRGRRVGPAGGGLFLIPGGPPPVGAGPRAPAGRTPFLKIR